MSGQESFRRQALRVSSQALTPALHGVSQSQVSLGKALVGLFYSQAVPEGLFELSACQEDSRPHCFPGASPEVAS